MSRSNWKGSAGWGSVDDPTGVLGDICLHASSGIGQLCEDYLVQEIGTSNAFNKVHYKVQCDLAYTIDENFNGSFSLVARAGNYTTSVKKPYIAQQGYIGIVDVANGIAMITRRFDNKDYLLFSVSLKTNILPNAKNVFSMSCYGNAEEGKTSIVLEMNGESIANCIDASGQQILSGDAGLQVQNGSVYINNFAIMELDSSGKPV